MKYYVAYFTRDKDILLYKEKDTGADWSSLRMEDTLEKLWEEIQSRKQLSDDEDTYPFSNYLKTYPDTVLLKEITSKEEFLNVKEDYPELFL